MSKKSLFIFVAIGFYTTVPAQTPYIDMPNPLPSYYEKSPQAKAELLQWANYNCDDRASFQNPDTDWFSDFLPKAVVFQKDEKGILHVKFGVKVAFFDYESKSYVDLDSYESKAVINRILRPLRPIHRVNLQKQTHKKWIDVIKKLNEAGKSLGVLFHGDIAFCNEGLKGDCAYRDASAKYGHYFTIQLRRKEDPFWRVINSRYGLEKLMRIKEHAYLANNKPGVDAESDSGFVHISGENAAPQISSTNSDFSDEAKNDSYYKASSVLLTTSDANVWLHELGHYLLLNSDAYRDLSVGYQGFVMLGHLNAHSHTNKMDPIEIATFLLRFRQEIPLWDSYVTGSN